MFIVCRLFNDDCSDWCEVIPHCSLIYISLMINDVEHLCMCLVAFLMSSLEKFVHVSAHFSVGCFLSDIRLDDLFVYFVDNPLSIASFTTISSYSEGCLFILFIVFFAA